MSGKRGRPPFLEEPVVVQVRIPADLLREVDEIASDNGQSRAEVVRDLLKAGLARWAE